MPEDPTINTTTIPPVVEEPKLVFPFTIGADPEFNLVSQNRMLNAKETMKLFIGTKMQVQTRGSDYEGYKVENAGNIGWDGHSTTGEIRPIHSNDPREVIKNLKTLFTEAHKHMPFIDMSTLSFYSSVGGHIHFGLKNEQVGNGKLDQIHKKLASFYLPIMLTENKLNLQTRIKTGYGKLNDKRCEQHGDVYTYEFRCPSAEWLTTEKIARATLSYLATVYNEIINHPKKFTKYEDVLYKTDKQGEALQMLCVTDFGTITKVIFNSIKKYIKNFEYYDMFKDDIEYILNPNKVLADKKKAGYNIIEGWGLAEKREAITKKMLVSQKEFEIKSKGKDLDTIKQFVRITANDDTNVAAFASILTSRVGAFNWKLKYSYILFGLRNGINSYMARNAEGNWIEGMSLMKSGDDINAGNILFDKVQNKYDNVSYRGININPNNGEISDMQSQTILIGIPYKERIKNISTGLLNLVWKIEKGELKPVRHKANPNTKSKEFYDIMNKKVEVASEKNPVFSDRGEQDHMQSIAQDIVREERTTSIRVNASSNPYQRGTSQWLFWESNNSMVRTENILSQFADDDESGEEEENS